MHSEQRLIERLHKVEALFAQPGTEGERLAAEQALHRIRERLEAESNTQRPEEFRFSLPDSWSRTMFIALLRRYGLTPFRYRRQRRTTIMVRAPRKFIDETLWPEFQELNAILVSHLDEVTQRIIESAFSTGNADVEERDTPALPSA